MHPRHDSIRKARRKSKGDASPLPDLLLKITDASLMGVIFLGPLIFGARHNLGRLLLAACCVLGAVSWFGRQALLGEGRWTRTIAYAVIMLAIGIVCVQLVPLPAEWLDAMSPRLERLLPLWDSHGPETLSFGDWQRITISVDSTRIALATLVAYALLFFTAVHRLQTTDDVLRVLRWIAASAVAMALFGVVQSLFANGKYFWFYTYPYSSTIGDLKGSFTNRNHFAHFLVLGIGPLISWIVLSDVFKARDPQPRVAQTFGPDQKNRFSLGSLIKDRFESVGLSCALVVLLIAVFASLSRGGITAMVGALCFSLAAYYRCGVVSARHFGIIGGLLLSALIGISMYGYEQAAGRFEDLATGLTEETGSIEARKLIWTTNLAAIRDGGWFGAGIGAHQAIYPAYLQEPYPRVFTHAENGYLQVATESGFLGIGLLMIGIGLCGAWSYRAIRHSRTPADHACAIGAATSLAASLIHSTVDFVWYVPACMALTILLAACVLRQSQLVTEEQASPARMPTLARPVWGAIALAVTIVGIWVVATLQGPGLAAIYWNRSLVANKAKQDLQFYRTKHPEESAEQLSQLVNELTGQSIYDLERALQWDPDFASAHSRLSSIYLETFDRLQQSASNSMTAEQIREAAIASQFQSAERLKSWLARAIGKNAELLYRSYYHSRRALQLCPTDSDAYLNMAILCFLEGKGHRTVHAYLNQALLVSPQNGSVLYGVGKQLIMLGQLEPAVTVWQKCMKASGTHQQAIVQIMAGNSPANEFLEAFQPEWPILWSVWQQYQAKGTEQDLFAIEQYTRATLNGTSESAPRINHSPWLQLASMQRHLDMQEAALASLEKAYQCSPGDYYVRRSLGIVLLENGKLTEADSHLRWCLRRKPSDAAVKATLNRASKEKLAHRKSIFQR